MTTWVLDASVTVSWLLKDEAAARAEAALLTLKEVDAVAPLHWRFETVNALLVAERGDRITQEETEERIRGLGDFPVSIDTQPDLQATLGMARVHALTFYDAIYLELAVRLGAPLATLDAALLRACAREGVPVPTA